MRNSISYIQPCTLQPEHIATIFYALVDQKQFPVKQSDTLVKQKAMFLSVTDSYFLFERRTVHCMGVLTRCCLPGPYSMQQKLYKLYIHSC